MSSRRLKAGNALLEPLRRNPFPTAPTASTSPGDLDDADGFDCRASASYRSRRTHPGRATSTLEHKLRYYPLIKPARHTKGGEAPGRRNRWGQKESLRLSKRRGDLLCLLRKPPALSGHVPYQDEQASPKAITMVNQGRGGEGLRERPMEE